MNNQTTNQITEADVASFLNRQIAERVIGSDFTVSVSASHHRGVIFSIYGHARINGVYEWVNAEGASVDAACAEFAGKIPTLATLAAKKREEAAKLLAEAAILEGGAK